MKNCNELFEHQILETLIQISLYNYFDFESKICKACESTKKDLGEDSPEYDMWYQVKDKYTKLTLDQVGQWSAP